MRGVLILTVVAQLFSTSFAIGGPPDWAILNRPAEAPISVPAFDKIHTTVQQNGSAKVIVRFAAPPQLSQGFQTEGKLKEHGRIFEQQAAIQGAQDTILARVPKRNANGAKRFKHIPFMALEVDQAELSTLLNSPEIASIEEDIPAPPSLTQSVPLIGGDGSGTFSGFTGSGQTVAILDTGVSKSHTFLAGKVIDEACFSTTYSGYASTTVCPNGQHTQTGLGAGANCSSAVSVCDHGTHVAGIAAGNGGGFSGVAKDATILADRPFPVSIQREAVGVRDPAPCLTLQIRSAPLTGPTLCVRPTISPLST